MQLSSLVKTIPSADGHSPVLVNAVDCPPPDCPTMLHYLERSVAQNPTRPFLGHRPKDAATGAFGAYVWQTYAEVVNRRIRAFSAGLEHLNMIDPTPDTGDRVLGIYMKNRPEWVVAHYAAIVAGGFSVALYDTLGADSTLFILNQTQTQTLVCTTSELTKVIEAKTSGAEHLKHVVLCDVDTTTSHVPQQQQQQAKDSGLTLWTMQAVETSTYTSGTTGEPKGVPLTHSNLVHAIAGLKHSAVHLCDQSILTPDAVHFSYLPLAHSIEHFSHSGMIMQSAGVAFYQGDTAKILDDLALARPTFFGVVPRLLNKIYDKVVHGTPPGPKGWLLKVALKMKLNALKDGVLRHGLFDHLIFSGKKIGLDRCSMVIVGSAPLAADVMDFFRVLFDCPVMEAYGLSETTGIAMMNHPSQSVAGDVGTPLGENQVKLISVPEMGGVAREIDFYTCFLDLNPQYRRYLTSDTTHGDASHRIPVRGRGEVCFRGPQVFQGYYKNPTATADALDSEGWLHTGDVGAILPDGRLKIVDRKKNIFKLSQGEYVAPERLENILITSALVDQVFVYGDSFQSVLVGIVVPQEAPLRRLANEVLGMTTADTTSFHELCSHPQVVAAVLQDLVVVSKQAKLFGFETIKAIKLHPHVFTVEDNFLTPTFKLKRNECKAAFAADIDALYDHCGDKKKAAAASN
ncbi:hypothetical protein DYB37_009616 [Aphanomyces astaci]|uniref:AMP-dependent synthetase/ligase domain-containing protein n=2 Tax=Aphanomyces astaci TaxID=112090 RepID=A0A3R6Y1S3_APHAT|nr:hypothetical protein DYB35_008352 [Aphanomyces astaci]RHZ18560.1 hypothetical protein DYB37_009616 [Aphanomyces astaci]